MRGPPEAVPYPAMVIIKLLIAIAIVAGTLFLLFRYHREIRGESTPSPVRGKRKDNAGSANELESFIAAYRRDKKAAAASEPLPASAPCTARTSLLTPHTKVCYMVLKTGLPDHHVFCNARLVDALEMHPAHPLAQARIDLVLCNNAFVPVAAIDVCDGDESSTAPEREKAECLRNAGIRHLRFTANGIPKPDEIRNLIYSA